MNAKLRQKAGLELVKELTFQEGKNTTWVLTQSVWKSSNRNLWEMKCVSFGEVIKSTQKSWSRLPKDVREMFNA